MIMALGNACAFVAGFTNALFWHGVRIAFWCIAVLIIAAVVGVDPTWRVLAVVMLANLLGLVMYPPGRDL